MLKLTYIFVRTIKSFLVVTFAINTISCTSLLWSDKRWYKETFKDFLITEDGKQLVIIGKQYHYIFDDQSGVIKKILSWEGKSKLEMELSDFKVTNTTDISGSVVIKSIIDKSVLLNISEKDFLEDEAGFTRKHRDNGRTSFFEKRIVLKGTRYLPKSGVNYNTRSRFNKEYTASIEYTKSGNNIAKIALTPVTVVGDGALIITGVAMTAVLIPISIGALVLAFTINGVVKDFKSLRNHFGDN